MEYKEMRIAVIGKPGAGKTKFLELLYHVPFRNPNRYFKTWGIEGYPIGNDTTLFEFGHHADVLAPTYLNTMNAIIQIGSCPYTDLPDVPICKIKRTGWNSYEDVQKIVDEFIQSL